MYDSVFLCLLITGETTFHTMEIAQFDFDGIMVPGTHDWFLLFY